MYSKEIERVMDKVSIIDWFERLIRVVESLERKEYVALSDVESYNTWIEFKKEKENLMISIIRAKKEEGSQDIEYRLIDIESGEWANQIVLFNQFKQEVVSKAKKYLEYIISQNQKQELFSELKFKIDNL